VSHDRERKREGNTDAHGKEKTARLAPAKGRKQKGVKNEIRRLQGAEKSGNDAEVVRREDSCY